MVELVVLMYDEKIMKLELRYKNYFVCCFSRGAIFIKTSKEGMVIRMINMKKFDQPNSTTIYPEIAGKMARENPIIEVKKEYWVARNLPWQIEAIKAI